MQVYSSHEVMVMVMEEFLPCLFKYLYVSWLLCLHIFKFFPWCWYHAMLLLKMEIYGMLVWEEKEVYVTLVMLYVFESCYVKKMEEQVKTMCKSLTCEWKKKRTMRSNRREAWGSWNLPPWLSTSWWVLVFLLQYEVFKSSLIVMLSMGNLA